jgi:hypothetical protein
MQTKAVGLRSGPSATPTPVSMRVVAVLVLKCAEQHKQNITKKVARLREFELFFRVSNLAFLLNL